MPGLFVLREDYANWLGMSQNVPRNSFAINALDRAVERYGANKTQANRIALARAIFRWYAQPTCNHAALANLLTRMSKDVGGAPVSAASLIQPPKIVIPLASYPNRSIVVQLGSLVDCDTYVSQVEAALREIASRPLGARLLMGINEQKDGRWPFVAAIFTRGSGNTCYPADASKGYDKINSLVRWDPAKEAIGDGTSPRPTYVGLAHELIHAYHNAMGVNLNGGAMLSPEEEKATVGLGAWWTDPQEMNSARFLFPFFDHTIDQDATSDIYRSRKAEQIRLGKFNYGPTLHITENMIRHEHGVQLRLFYGGTAELNENSATLAFAYNHRAEYQNDITAAISSASKNTHRR